MIWGQVTQVPRVLDSSSVKWSNGTYFLILQCSPNKKIKTSASSEMMSEYWRILGLQVYVPSTLWKQRAGGVPITSVHICVFLSQPLRAEGFSVSV
jgi:hypothetical protein